MSTLTTYELDNYKELLGDEVILKPGSEAKVIFSDIEIVGEGIDTNRVREFLSLVETSTNRAHTSNGTISLVGVTKDTDFITGVGLCNEVVLSIHLSTMNGDIQFDNCKLDIVTSSAYTRYESGQVEYTLFFRYS